MSDRVGQSEVRSQGLPLVNGQPVAEGYGVLIERDKELGMSVIFPVTDLRAPEAPLIAWLTKRNADGEYEPLYQLTPEASVTGWDTEGRAFTFEHGVLTLREVRDAQI